MIVASQTYETTDPTVDSQIASLQGTGAEYLLVAATPKFAAQAIRKVYDLGWKPSFFLTNVSASVGSVMKPAGLEKAVGIITAGYLKDPNDPQWQSTKEYKDWLEFMKKYYPGGSLADVNNVYGYSAAQTLVDVLKASGDNLTRENVMKQAASIHDLKLPMLLPGISVSTSADGFRSDQADATAKIRGRNLEVVRRSDLGFGQLTSRSLRLTNGRPTTAGHSV